MRRREFVTLLGSAAVTWPALARAQQSTIPTVGFLSTRSPDESAHQLAAFHRGLAENGYVENQNVTVEYRWAMGQYDQMAPLAAELVRRSVGVLVAVGGDPSALKEKMFNPFFTTKPSGEGTGLGLSISHDIIVKQHGGSIEVDTRPGEFTEIRVILPRTAALLSDRS